MNIDDAFEIKKADPDSQYRLLPCKKCKGDNVAYVHYNGLGDVAGYNFKGIVENKPLHVDTTQIAAVIRVLSDEIEEDAENG